MEEPVAIGDNPAGRIRDRLAQAAGGIDGWNPHDQGSIGVGVSRGVHLEDICSRGLHVDTGLGSRQSVALSCIGMALRIVTSRAKMAKPDAVTSRWYGFGGILLNRNVRS